MALQAQSQAEWAFANHASLTQLGEVVAFETEQLGEHFFVVLPEQRSRRSVPAPGTTRETHWPPGIPMFAHDGVVDRFPELPRLHLLVLIDRVGGDDRLGPGMPERSKGHGRGSASAPRADFLVQLVVCRQTVLHGRELGGVKP